MREAGRALRRLYHEADRVGVDVAAAGVLWALFVRFNMVPALFVLSALSLTLCGIARATLPLILAEKHARRWIAGMLVFASLYWGLMVYMLRAATGPTANIPASFVMDIAVATWIWAQTCALLLRAWKRASGRSWAEVAAATVPSA